MLATLLLLLYKNNTACAGWGSRTICSRRGSGQRQHLKAVSPGLPPAASASYMMCSAGSLRAGCVGRLSLAPMLRLQSRRAQRSFSPYTRPHFLLAKNNTLHNSMMNYAYGNAARIEFCAQSCECEIEPPPAAGGGKINRIKRTDGLIEDANLSRRVRPRRSHHAQHVASPTNDPAIAFL